MVSVDSTCVMCVCECMFYGGRGMGVCLNLKCEKEKKYSHKYKTAIIIHRLEKQCHRFFGLIENRPATYVIVTVTALSVYKTVRFL